MSERNPLIGLQIDNYQIKSLLGQGGMASVYLATDVSLQRDVVIKVLLPNLAENEELRLRFQREAQATARLHHPNIVQVFTTGSMPDSFPYIALQYIEGGALSDHLQQLAKQGQWISVIYALSTARQMAGALQVAHQANIVHRDLKPSNILLRNDGTPVLSDLGIAAIQQATMRLTQTGGIIGTPNYMSPEQASSQVIDGRSDIYSLGVILYELLSGRLPFDADSPWAILHQHIYEQPTPLAQIRPDLTAQTHQVVETCLQKQPDDRFPDAQAFVVALDGAIAAENANPLITVSATQATVVEQAAMPIPGTVDVGTAVPKVTKVESQKRPRWPYVLIITLLLLVSLGAFFIWQQARDPEVIAEPEATPAPTVIVVTATSAPLQPSPTFVSTITVETVPEIVSQQPAEPTPEFVNFEVSVDAAEGLYDSGIMMVPGQTVTIAYIDGEWRAGPSSTWPLVGPEGDPQVPSKATFPVPDAPIASLVAGIGFETPFLVGRGTSYVANSAGNLWLAANDDGNDDNQGEIRVSIHLGLPPDDLVEASPISQGMIAYGCGSTGQEQIFLFDLDRSEQFLLPKQPQNSVVPAFSQDGRRVAYRSDESGTWQIYVSDIDGGNRRQVTSGPGNNMEANWSADGSRIAFVSDRTGSKQIFVMNSDGTNQQQITFNNSDNDDPSWSVTNQIAYESDQDGRFSIYQLPAQGGAPFLLIDYGDSSSTPAWSADGRQIAFESRRGNVRHIWIALSDGAIQQRLTEEGTQNNRPAWSPDGRRITFHSNYSQADREDYDIWLKDIETGELTRLTSRGDCYNPAWGQSSFAKQPVAPIVREGIEACSLRASDKVTAGPNTRFWNIPDVLAGQALESVDAGTSLRVIDGPEWGRIRRDIDVSEWWWQVEREPDGATGWVWQARLRECEGP